MGSKTITKERAMALLDVSQRTIYRLMNSGVIRPVPGTSRLSFLEEEIIHLKRVREDPYTFNKDLLGMLLAKVQTLEAQMTAVMRILNIRHDALELTGPEYRNLHIMAEHFATEGWPPHAEEQWADTFVRFRLEDLEQIQAATSDQHPWRPFLKLASTMHLGCYDKNLRNQLASGKTNVFQVAGLWCTLKGETAKTFDMLVKRDTEPSKKLVKRFNKRVEDS